VWEYTDADEVEIDETVVRPVVAPVEHFSSRVVGTKVRLAGGRLVPALISNVDIDNPRATKQFLTLKVFTGRRSFDLARYHDFDCEERGPHALAALLGLRVDDVFPIEYDLRPYSSRTAAALHGLIEKEPRERLTRGELMKLSLDVVGISQA
jgi:hypothetical protein